MDLWNLSDTTDFVVRSHCGNWSDGHIRLAQVADGAVATGYLVIASMLALLWWERKAASKHLWILLNFVVFLFLCGVTHVCQILSFYWPAYRLFTMATVLTGVASVTTAVMLPMVVARVRRTPIAQQLLEQMGQERSRDQLQLDDVRSHCGLLETELEAEKARYAVLARTIQEMQVERLNDARVQRTCVRDVINRIGEKATKAEKDQAGT